MRISNLIDMILFRDPKSSHNKDEIKAVKEQGIEALSVIESESIKKSGQAGRNFDKMGKRMESMGMDISVRIARATRDAS